MDQLQNALDQLKHGTQPDQEVIRSVRSEITTAPWLKLKQKQRIAEMDEHLPVPDRDKVGKLYNFLRKELGRYFSDSAVAPLSDFRGLIGGAEFTPEIFAECSTVNKYYANVVMQALSRRRELWEQLEQANAEVEAKKDDADARKEAIFRRNQASSTFRAYEERSREELRALIDQVRAWAQGKNGTRLAYLSALHSIVCRDRRPDPEQESAPALAQSFSMRFRRRLSTKSRNELEDGPSAWRSPISATARWKSTGRDGSFWSAISAMGTAKSMNASSFWRR